MQKHRIQRLNRRQFCKSFITGTAILLTPESLLGSDTGLGSDTCLESIINIPGIEVTVRKWEPVDLTKRFKARLSEEILFKKLESSGFMSNYTTEVSPNGEWWWAVFPEIIQEKGYRYPYLVDAKAKRILALSDGDDKIAKFPDSNFDYYWGPTRICDNGTSIYGIMWRDPKRKSDPKDKDLIDVLRGIESKDNDLSTIMISDIKNSRKIAIRGKGARVIDLSQKGTRGIIEAPAPGKLYVFDLRTGKIVQTIECQTYPDLGSSHNSYEINYDASVVIFYRNMEYYRLDIDKKKINGIWSRNLTRTDFTLSPDGNFCACQVEAFGPSYVEIYVHEPFNRFRVCDPHSYRERPIKFNNDGTLKTFFIR